MNTEKNQMKTDMNATGQTMTLNDIGFRLILIPFFGIAIPLLTGMINGKNFNHWEFKLSFLYTILIAFIVWQGNRYLLFTLRAYFHWFNQPVRKIIALLLAISFYTIPVSALLLTGWYTIFAKGNIEWDKVFTATLIIMICVIFITHVYETVFLVKESESEIVRREQVERARAEAELEALKNQIDPHFIFNSLNTLSHLIDEQPAKAKQFNEHLADVYRYILQHKGKDLVLLQDEIHFVKDYCYLMMIRFEKAIQLIVHLTDETSSQFLVPPISLQVLVENAIKHNEFSESNPLKIEITLAGSLLSVKNTLLQKENVRHSSGIGLKNLEERYRLITGQKIIINKATHEFSVSLPVLKIE